MSQPPPVFNGPYQCHELKCWPDYFLPITQGRKRFEIRRNDRGFQTGDYLWLREWSPFERLYTGAGMVFKVTYMLRSDDCLGLAPDFVALSIAPIPDEIREDVLKAFRDAEHAQLDLDCQP